MLLIQPEYQKKEVWTALAEEHHLGYEVLELSLPPALEPGPARMARLDWYRRGGRVRSLHGAFIGIDPGSGDPAIRRLSMSRCRESCQAAQALGAEWVVFHSSAFPYLNGRDYLDAWAGRCSEAYLELAETYGLTICIENSLDLGPEALALLLNRTGDRRLRACLDLGHAHYGPTPLEKWFDALGEHLACVHLSDNHGRWDEHLPLGAGTVNWALGHRLWAELPAPVPATLEVGGPKGVEQSLAWLSARGYFGAEG